jgi:NAD(P)-dependent dehydrogenase (short-subunit alcohol dehydrogenase family)
MDRRDSRRGSAGLALAAAGAGAFLLARSVVRQRRWLDLDGKTALITGGSRGFGLLLAREFARQGANVVICARDEAELDRARHDLAGRGARVEAIPCDVTDRSQVERLVRDAEGRFGGIDVLVNNAGTISVGPMEVMTLEDYHEVMNIHFWGPLYTTLAALPGMKSRGGGRIVNIASIGGKVPAPHLLPYTASKFALVGFSEGLRAELKKDNVYVTTVCPGLIRTGSPRNATFKGQHRAEYAWFSVSDSLPLTSMNAARGARRVVLACQRGEAEVILSIEANLAARFHGLFPGLSTEVLGAVNTLLPGPGGIGTERAKGWESESPVSRSFLTAPSRRAAAENNELTGDGAQTE